MKLQLKRSNVIASGAAKIPTAAQLEYGELAINYNQQDPAIFLKDSNNNVIRIGGIGNIADDGQVELPTTTNPPTSPTPLNGNLWYNSQDGRLYVYYVDANSAQWVDASPDNWQSTVIPDITDPAYQAGTLDDRYINISGDTLTGALLLDNAAAAATPDLAFDGDLNTGIYSPGADSLAITTAGTQRVVVDSSGKFVVGAPAFNSASAGSIAQIEASGTEGGIVINSSDTSANKYSRLIFTKGNLSGNEGLIRYNVNDYHMAFWTNGTEKLKIDSSGNLTFSQEAASNYPEQKLKWSNDSTTANGFYLSQDTNRNGRVWHEQGLDVLFGTANTERMRIDSSGNVGIGSSAPTSDGWSAANDLVISSTGNSGITIKSGTSGFGQLDFNDAPGGLRGFVAYGHTDDYLGFGTVAAERMRIDSSGKMLLGTTTDSGANLTVYGTSSATVYQNAVTGTGTTGNGMFVGNWGSTPGYLYNYENDALIFGTNNAERMRILSSGGLTFNGDTTQANALDDYEEGTWTPIVHTGGLTASTIYGATYVKIGSQVTVWSYVTLTGTGTTAVFQMGGLPFTSITNNYSPCIADFGAGGQKGAYGRVDSNATTMSFLYSSENPSITRPNLLGNQVGSGQYFIFSVTYRTA